MTLRTTVVGCGAVAQKLYRGPLQQLEKRGILRVLSLIDPVTARAATLGRFFPRARLYPTLEEAFRTSTADLTLILSPAHLHCGQTLGALASESHVLCEKPMANTEAECARMTAAAAEAQRVLAIGMIRRYHPAFAQLKREIESGRLGDLRSFEYREGHKFEWEVTTPAAFRPRREGGTGVLFDIGPHVVDHLSWTFGALQVVDYADDALAGIESNTRMDVLTPTCPGTIHLSWDNPQSNELRVRGSRGEAVLRIDRFDQLAISTPNGYAVQPISVTYPADLKQDGGTTISPISYPQAIYCQLVQVARAIVLGEPAAVDGESGRQTVALLESALGMARPIAIPWLDEREQSTFAQLHWNSCR